MSAHCRRQAFPQITNQSLATEGTLNSGPAVFYSRNVVLGVSKSLGKHELKAGYVYRSISVTFTNVGTGNGTYAFDSSYTSSSGSKTPARARHRPAPTPRPWCLACPHQDR